MFHRSHPSTRRWRLFTIGVLLQATLAATTAAPVVAQSHPASEAVLKSATNVLQTCDSWPLQFARRPSDRARPRNDRALDTTAGQSQLMQQLSAALGLDPTIAPRLFDGSLLRLLDTVGDLTIARPNTDLLNIARDSSFSEISLWGTSLNTIKYDCITFLSLAAKGSANLSIPLFSLDAALDASRSTSTNEVAIYLIGTFQSPFLQLYNSDERSRRLYASLRALSWRMRFPLPSSDSYVATAHVLSLSNTFTSSENESIAGHLKAGLPIPIVNLSGEASARLTTTLKADGSMFTTYYWNEVPKSLPPLEELLTSVSRALPPFDLVNGPELAATPRVARAHVVGWPGDLCATGQWAAGAANTLFTVSNRKLTAGVSQGGLPTCDIEIEFTLSGASQPKPGEGDAGLYLSPAILPLTHITLTTPLLVPLGQSSFFARPVSGTWALPTDTAGQRPNFEWTLSGRVDVTGSGREITQLRVNPADFSCQLSGGQSVPMSDVFFSGPAAAGLVRSGPEPVFTITIRRSVLGPPAYVQEATPDGRRSCVPNGVLHITTNTADNRNPVTEDRVFQTAPIYFPNEAATERPPAPSGLSASSLMPGEAIVAWVKEPGSSGYAVYRATNAAGPFVKVSAATLTEAKFSDGALTSGATYIYQVSSFNSVGEGPRSTSTSVVIK